MVVFLVLSPLTLTEVVDSFGRGRFVDKSMETLEEWKSYDGSFFSWGWVGVWGFSESVLGKTPGAFTHVTPSFNTRGFKLFFRCFSFNYLRSNLRTVDIVTSEE